MPGCRGASSGGRGGGGTVGAGEGSWDPYHMGGGGSNTEHGTYAILYIPESSNMCKIIAVSSKTMSFDPTAIIFACRQFSVFAHSSINQNCKTA